MDENQTLVEIRCSTGVKSFRESLAPEATRVIAAVMNDPGAGLAADRTVQLKAATTLLGENASGNGGTNVQINLGGAGKIRAGVVIRMPAAAKRTPG